MNKQAVLSLSGGMDSSTLLLHLLANDYEVTALSFDYGQKHRVELDRAKELVKYINERFTEINAVNDIRVYPGKVLPLIKHQVIKLDGLQELLNSALVQGGSEVPEGHYEQDNMKDTVVPNRNKMFSSIIQAVTLSISTKNNCDVQIAMGIHAGDHAIYPDCRVEFRDADFYAFFIGNWGSEKVHHYTPYLEIGKYEILQDGVECCAKLGIQFNEVYKRTNTSYKPIFIEKWNRVDGATKETYSKYPNGGVWYSDYKSAASVERIEAFIQLGRPDPVEYADETGPVTWEVAKAAVEKVLFEHQTNSAY
jgi:7-cyano-7-deazaguanine synthase